MQPLCYTYKIGIGLLVLLQFAGLIQLRSQSNTVPVEVKYRVFEKGAAPRYSEWKLFQALVVDSVAGFKPRTTLTTSRYGGDLNRRFKATGFFRVEKINGRWWAIDPDGYAYIYNAVNTITTGGSDSAQIILKEKYATEDDWMEATQQLLAHNGFTGAGGFSNEKLIRSYNSKAAKPLVYAVSLRVMAGYAKKRGGTHITAGHTGYPNNTIFVFDPAFEQFSDEYIKEQVSPLQNDRNLFGYFSDNEMPFSQKNLEDYLALTDTTDHGYVAASHWLREKGITAAQITDEHRAAFLAYEADRYYSLVSKALKKYDPHHLYIGSRIYLYEKKIPEFMRVAGKYLDVLSIHHYGNWVPTATDMNNWNEWSGKPFIISEFYVKAEDSGLPNTATSGAGWLVKTQQDRGLFYQNWCLALLRSKNCVGWNWFKYQDNDPQQKDAEISNIDSNKGIVTNRYKEYPALLEKMKQLNLNRFDLIRHFDESSY